MSIISRHVFTAIVFSLLITLATIGVTLAVFPLDDWSLIWNQTFYDVPFLVFVIGIPIVSGVIIGVSMGWYWRQRLQRVSKHLDEIEKARRFLPMMTHIKNLQEFNFTWNKYRKEFGFKRRMLSG